MLNRYIISISLTGITALSYFGISKYRQCGANSDTIIGITASTFALLINLFLLVELAQAPEADLGRFSNSRGTIILAMVLMVVYTTISIFESFSRVLACAH